MISKKVLGPALTGTGAVGATGSLAWALGLFDGEGLDDVEGKKELPNSAAKPLASVPPGGVREGKDFSNQTVAKVEVAAAATVSSGYFSSGEATASDKKVIKESLTWEVKWTSGGLTSLWINAEGGDFTWGCRLKPISIATINPKNDSEFLRQGRELIDAIKNNNAHKEKFVENCSRSKRDERTIYMGSDGEIELEAEKDSNGNFKFKEKNGYFKKLWIQDFGGIDKLSKEDAKLIDVRTEGWNIEETKEVKDKTKKVKISLKNNAWICSISGNYGGNLGARIFEKEKLEKILNLSNNFGYQNEVEWKRYLIRNCAKNKKNIRGLAVRIVGNDKWEFSDLEKIYEGMYTNPTTAT